MDLLLNGNYLIITSSWPWSFFSGLHILHCHIPDYVQVAAWTVNTVEMSNQLKCLHVDYIISDYPGTALYHSQIGAINRFLNYI